MHERRKLEAATERRADNATTSHQSNHAAKGAVTVKRSPIVRMLVVGHFELSGLDNSRRFVLPGALWFGVF
jgi:hypothetical protein